MFFYFLIFFCSDGLLKLVFFPHTPVPCVGLYIKYTTCTPAIYSGNNVTSPMRISDWKADIFTKHKMPEIYKLPRQTSYFIFYFYRLSKMTSYLIFSFSSDGLSKLLVYSKISPTLSTVFSRVLSRLSLPTMRTFDPNAVTLSILRGGGT